MRQQKSSSIHVPEASLGYVGMTALSFPDRSALRPKKLGMMPPLHSTSVGFGKRCLWASIHELAVRKRLTDWLDWNLTSRALLPLCSFQTLSKATSVLQL